MTTTKNEKEQKHKGSLFRSNWIIILVAVVAVAGLLYFFLPRSYAGYTMSASQYRQISKLKKDIVKIDGAIKNPNSTIKVDEAKKAIDDQQKYAPKADSISLKKSINSDANKLKQDFSSEESDFNLNDLVMWRTLEITKIPDDKTMTSAQAKKFQKILHQIYRDTGQE